VSGGLRQCWDGVIGAHQRRRISGAKSDSNDGPNVEPHVFFEARPQSINRRIRICIYFSRLGRLGWRGLLCVERSPALIATGQLLFYLLPKSAVKR
jgi:hypothetical protein